ncbi:MAG: alpha/beta hydrolase [Candidatus Obscuribacterales bacterium]
MVKKQAVASAMLSLCLGTVTFSATALAQTEQSAPTADQTAATPSAAGNKLKNLTPQQRQRLQQFIQRRRARQGGGAGLGAGGAGLGAGGTGMGAGRRQMATVNPEKVDARFNIAYGDAGRQKLDVYIPKKLTSPAPLLIFVHGGGWQRGSKDLQREKGISYAENGIVTVCTNYRLAPSVMHPKQVEDVAAAVAWAKKHATELGADPNRIFIMGHSAGAQLVDLLGTNERFLKEQGLSLSDIKGVISLDTASLNLGERVKEGSVEGLMVGDMITQAFGTNPKVLADASPTLNIHAGSKYPPFLMYCGERRVSCVAQHKSFETALNKVGGSKVTVKPVPLNHGDISKYAGTTTTPMFKEILQFISAQP